VENSGETRANLGYKLELVFLFSKSIKEQGSVKNNPDHLSKWVCAPILTAL